VEVDRSQGGGQSGVGDEDVTRLELFVDPTAPAFKPSSVGRDDAKEVKGVLSSLHSQGQPHVFEGE
jgi:hypothetical protein